MVGAPGNVATYIPIWPICKHILETEKLCSAESRGVLCDVSLERYGTVLSDWESILDVVVIGQNFVNLQQDQINS